MQHVSHAAGAVFFEIITRSEIRKVIRSALEMIGKIETVDPHPLLGMPFFRRRCDVQDFFNFWSPPEAAIKERNAPANLV
jgi:hypothetical protein